MLADGNAVHLPVRVLILVVQVAGHVPCRMISYNAKDLQ